MGPLGETSSQGDLVLGGASRLASFSCFPVRPLLPGSAPGVTTGTPEVRPSRSSRTKDSSPSNLQRLRKIGTKLSHACLSTISGGMDYTFTLRLRQRGLAS